MPQQRRLRRIGSAATAVSATALVVTVLGSPAAYAGTATTTATAARTCKKGTDPKSTLENWKCQLDDLRDRIDHHNTPSPTPTRSKPPAKTVKSPGGDGKGDNSGGGNGERDKAPQGNGGGGDGGGPRVNVPTGNGPSLMSDQAPQPFPAAAPNGRQSNLTGLLPAPQVAGPDGVQPGGAPVPQTRLVSPVAASEPTKGGQMIWVAGSAAVIGAAAALNLSHIARQMRRRPTRR
ncbi:hypothetical protein [Actinomadura oligospora]|uniref:hypothetical protein n=1 Tax=Actinomadura oligospora TaxID=111804 RepID=UPI00047C81FA|nr:hypothetical protein [Actinomadura oligospora]